MSEPSFERYSLRCGRTGSGPEVMYLRATSAAAALSGASKATLEDYQDAASTWIAASRVPTMVLVGPDGRALARFRWSPQGWVVRLATEAA